MSTPPPLPALPRQKKPVSGCALGCMTLIACAAVAFAFLMFAGSRVSQSIAADAPAARERLKERFENARALNAAEEIQMPPVLPGLSAKEVCAGLVEEGFRLQTSPGKTQTMLHLSDTDYSKNRSVSLYSPSASPDTPHVVTCLAKSEDAKGFLGWMASIPIRGTGAASAWVKDHIGYQTAKAFYGVKFQLMYNPETDFHTLRISMERLNDGDFPPLPEKPEPAPAEAAAPTPPEPPPEAAPKPEPEATAQPLIGHHFNDIVATHGPPSVKDADTGWAWWKDFKARFINGKVVEVTPKE